MFPFFNKKPKKKSTPIVKRKHSNSIKLHSAENKRKGLFAGLIKKDSKVKKRGQSSNDKKDGVKPYELLFDFKLNHDNKLFAVFMILILVGIIAIFSSTIVFAYRYTGDRYYYLFSHLRLLAVGSIVMVFFYFLRIEFITKFRYILYGIVVSLLLYLVFLSFTTTDAAIDGATRWIQLGGFQFQPSEFAKLAFLIFVASFLARMPNHYRDTNDYIQKNFLPFAISFFIVVGLILLGRNLGTALVVGFIGMVCYFMAANSSFQKAGFLVLIGFIAIGGVIFGIYESYRADRIAVWTNYLKTGDTAILEKDGVVTRDQRSYQFDQVLTACGSGGFLGQGLGQSVGKYYFVKTTAGDDSIICIIGEELGFPFTVGIILLYVYLVYVCLNIAKKLVDKPEYYFIMVGFASWVGFQMFVHVGANLGVIPLTGQTLPFISLGGSSIIALMGGMGLALNVSKQTENS